MYQQNIAQLHEEVLVFLNTKRQEKPNLYFTLRKNNQQNRFEKGYWFWGNDEALYFSFWGGMDRITNTPNISITINKRREMYIFLNARDDEKKAQFFENLVEDLGKFTRTQNFEANTVENVWRRSYRQERWQDALTNFINNEVGIINQQLKLYQKLALNSSNDNFHAITAEEFRESLLGVERMRNMLTEVNNIALPQYYPINLTSLNLQNIGHFRDVTINLNKRITCLIGYNGSGKSTILRALALSLVGVKSLVTENRQLVGKETFNEWLHITNYDSNGKPIYADTGTIELVYQLDRTYSNKLEFLYDEKLGVLASDVIEGDANFSTLDNEQTKYLFIGFPQGSGFRKPIPLNGDNFPEPIDLLPLIKNEAHEKMERLKVWIDVTYSKHLEALKNENKAEAETYLSRIKDVFRLISLVTSNSEQDNQVEFHNLFYDTDGKNKIANIIIKINNFGNDVEQIVALNLVSQGFQNLFYWIGELVSRCYQVNEYYNTNPAHTYKAKDSIFEMEGVILIDEIDTYLHPKWQRNILKVLVEEFPKLQFVVTTHSLAVISSLQDKNDYLVYKAAKFNNNIFFSEINPLELNPYGADFNEIAEEFMEMSYREPIIQADLDSLASFIAEKNIDKATEIVNKLNNLINPDNAEFMKLKSRLEAKKLLVK